MQGRCRSLREPRGSLLIDSSLSGCRHCLPDSDYDCAVEYQVVTVSAVMQALEKESILVTRVKKTTEPTVQDKRHICYKAESSLRKEKCAFEPERSPARKEKQLK